MQPPEGEPTILPASILLTPDHTVIIAMVVMVILLACSALISGSEVAFFSLRSADLKKVREGGTPASTRIMDLLSKPRRLLATILISNNFVNVAIVILSSMIVEGLFNFEVITPFTAFAIQVVAVTFLIVLFGEVLPKVYATSHALILAGFMSQPLYLLRYIFRPLNNLLVESTSFLEKRFKKRSSKAISMDALGHALELTEDEHTTEEEKRILSGIVKFGNIDVRQIMTPRTDVLALDQEMGYKEMLEKVLASGYSRVPVHKDSLDKIQGVLYIKDLLPHLKRQEMDWHQLMREPFFVPENKKLDDLLSEFREKKVHLAIVVDEYGGMLGIVTMEDVIEEIVGDITDEFDDEDVIHSKLDENTFIFEGKVLLNDMYRIMGIDGKVLESHKGVSETLGGLILEMTGRFPNKHERIDFKNFVFTIEGTDDRRIRRVKVRITERVDVG